MQFVCNRNGEVFSLHNDGTYRREGSCNRENAQDILETVEYYISMRDEPNDDSPISHVEWQCIGKDLESQIEPA